MKRWKLEDAKNQFSEVVRRALEHRPRHVTRNGKGAVVVISAEDYARLVAPQDLVSFLRDSPHQGEVTVGQFKPAGSGPSSAPGSLTGTLSRWENER